MYAVFEVAGFQFSAKTGEVVKVPLQKADVGKKLAISNVLLVKSDDTVKVGTPFLEGASVEAEVIGHGKGDKVRVYKYKRRTKYRKTTGHRQDYTEIKVSNITAP
jgi:large subunit ribosomal protein L21